MSFSPNRHPLLAFLFLATLIAWADRVNLSVAAPAIMREFRWDKLTMGIAFSAFTWGMILCLFPAGWLADRFGGLKVFTAGAFFWSVFTLLVPFTESLLGLAVARALLGVSEASYQPGQVAITSQCFPKEQAGKTVGILASGTPIGLMVATPIAAWLMNNYGWRAIFYAFGAAGLAWCAAILLFTRGRLTIQDSGTPNGTCIQARRPFRLPDLLRSRPVLGIACFQMINMYCFWMFLTWLPTYLFEGRSFQTMQMGLATAVPYSATFLGYVGAGWVSDRLVQRGLGRKSVLYIGSLGTMAFTALAAGVQSAAAALLCLSLTMACLGANATTLLTLPVDLAPERSGAIVGFTGLVGFLGGAAAPVVTGYIVQRTDHWPYALYVVAALAALGLAVARWMISLEADGGSHLPPSGSSNQ